MSPARRDLARDAGPARHALVGELFCADAERDWQWEGILAGGKLHLYCYLRDTVVALAPFDVEA